MRTAVCSGSFDPITLGHLDIIRRAAAMFDKVYVCVVPNAAKTSQMFTPEQKLRLVEAAVQDIPNVEAELWPGLLAEFAQRHDADVIVRGVRNGTDFDAEYQLALINRSLCANPDTILLTASAECQHMSSSMAREMIRYDQPLEICLPAAVIPMVREMRKEEK